MTVTLDILHVVGARPNFPKLAPVYRALEARGVSQQIVHTGQHYDDLLSDSFFRLLALPSPAANLDVGSGSHAVQTARILERLEPVLLERRPRWLVVYGDVNTTAAAALVAAKLEIPVAHVEAGLRSFDRSMPEEINRLVTDRLSSLLLTPSRDADAQLLREGHSQDQIAFVGNVMIDSLMHALPHTDSAAARERHGLGGDALVVVTLHRPSNVDDVGRLDRIVQALDAIAADRTVLLVAHPRMTARMTERSVLFDRVRVHGALPYLDMLGIVRSASLVITDSGGLQEETSVLGVPCLTIRPNTERPITITHGTNVLVPEPEQLQELAMRVVRPAAPPSIEGWDGRAGERTAAAIVGRLA